MNAYMDEIIPLLKELIEFKSTASRPGEINRCADFIEAYVKQTGAVFRKNGKIYRIARRNQHTQAARAKIDSPDGSNMFTESLREKCSSMHLRNL